MKGLKFYLRIYVMETIMDPWRIYIQIEGFARFAVDQYDLTTSKNAKHTHLTNFSLNKRNDKLINNLSADQDDQSYKWSLQAINKYLEKFGIDMNLLWS